MEACTHTQIVGRRGRIVGNRVGHHSHIPAGSLHRIIEPLCVAPTKIVPHHAVYNRALLYRTHVALYINLRIDDIALFQTVFITLEIFRGDAGIREAQGFSIFAVKLIPFGTGNHCHLRNWISAVERSLDARLFINRFRGLYEFAPGHCIINLNACLFHDIRVIAHRARDRT